MESHSIEQRPQVELREVALTDEETLKQISALVTKYSWFADYPVDPMDELKESDYIAGAYQGDTLVGFGTINRVASPDGQDNGEWWFGDAVVLPEHEGRGVYQRIYDARMQWLRDKPGRLLTCVEGQKMDGILARRGWRKIRDTHDEGGNPCRVYEFPREQAGPVLG